MQIVKALIATIAVVSCLTSCAQNKPVQPVESHPLYKFAQANCLFQYFQKKGYDSDGLRAISGEIVETSEYSPERYQEIAQFLANYETPLASKANIEVDLNTCFNLDKSPELKELILRSDNND